MEIDLREISKFNLPTQFSKGTKIVRVTKGFVLFKAGNLAIIGKPATAFGSNNYSLEKERRRKATQIAFEELSELTLKTEFIDFGGIQKIGSEANIIQLIGRVMPWIDNVEEMREVPFKNLIIERQFNDSVRRVALFALSQLINHGRMFDLFCFNTIQDIFKKDGSLSHLLISNNIFTGAASDTRARTIFIDPDWFFMLSDSKITGFKKSSYTRRMINGSSFLLILILLLLLGKLFFDFRRKSSTDL